MLQNTEIKSYIMNWCSGSRDIRKQPYTRPWEGLNQVVFFNFIIKDMFPLLDYLLILIIIFCVFDWWNRAYASGIRVTSTSSNSRIDFENMHTF